MHGEPGAIALAVVTLVLPLEPDNATILDLLMEVNPVMETKKNLDYATLSRVLKSQTLEQSNAIICLRLLLSIRRLHFWAKHY